MEERPTLPLVFTSVAVTAMALLSWAAVSLLYVFWTAEPGVIVLPPLIALPGVGVGSVLTLRTGNWWWFCIGIVITLLTPLLMLAWGSVLDPAPGGFAEMD